MRSGATETFWNILLLALAGAIIFTGIRLIRGPSLADRVLALDVIAAIAVAAATVYAVAHRQPVFLDVAIVIALVSFVATVAFAKFIERQGIRR